MKNDKRAFASLLKRLVTLGLMVCSVIGEKVMLPAWADDGKIPMQEIIALNKKIELDVGAINIEWSPDGKFFAFTGLPTGEVNIVEVATGAVRHVEIPKSENFRGIESLAWSLDGSQLAAVNARVLIIMSTKTLQISQRLDAEPMYYMAGPMAFTKDGHSILVECVSNSGTLIARIDLDTLKTTPVIRELRVGDVTASAVTGRFQRNGDDLGFGTIGGFSIGKKELRSRDVNHEPTGIILGDMRNRCYLFSLIPEVTEHLFIDLPDTTEVGIDGSGIHRYWDDCVLSPMHRVAVVFSRGYEKLPWMVIDESKDKAFEVYDTQSRQRLTAFGGFGSPETSCITNYDIHPSKSWVFSIARKAKGSYGQTVGLVTVWDMRTGLALQRVEIPEGPIGIRLSPDGQRLLINISGGQLLVFNVI